ncbi:hypothetical protein C0J52_13802 [Blattella germanica]|nr:hypothetical protein C0J52_13802 [Blattella germanica]
MEAKKGSLRRPQKKPRTDANRTPILKMSFKMGDSLPADCKELDLLTMHILDLMEEYIKCKMRMEDMVKASCLDLAKARYIMGNHSVSQLQLPTEESDNVTASTTVVSKDENKRKVECKVFRLQKEGETDKGGVRQRTTEQDSTKGEKNGTVSDPLKWFGYLVPQNLRQAQKGFKNVLELVMECANIQSELEASRKKCNELKKKLVVSES